MAYKHVIRANTKNLFNKNNATIINGYIYSGQLIITESPVDRTIVFPCKPNTTYTFSKMYTNRLFMAETSEETPAIGTTCTNPIANLGEPPSQNYCTLTTTATAKNLIITVCALFNTETYTLQEILDSVQIEEGSTPTPYTPYNYLQSNKRMIKVSNVCQLLDKDNLNSFVVGNLDKITVTDNKDGTFIINGSYSNTYNSWYILNEWSVEKGNISQIVEGHKYLLLDDVEKVSGDIHSYIIIWYVDGSSQSNDAGIITSLKTTKLEKVRVQYSIHEGDTADNVISKPQLFDLTEMFGAGHEPTTVAEFRQRFPNEYYPYSPYNYLSSNKRMIKVSNVCQLLDKDNLNSFVVGNLDKITVTDNKDGTFIINGSYSNTYNSWYILNEWDVEKGNISQIVEGHKYLLLGDVEKVSGDIHLGIVIWYVDGSLQSNYAGIITSLKTTKLETVRVQYSIHEGDTADNAISKPQLFDLTEMFGAGHEPATVAEFRQRFPNEYYPYSPQCWLTSYKSAVVCKTKNLFDVNNAVPYTFTNDNPPSSRISLKDGIYTTTFNNYNVGSGLRIKDGLVLSPGTYTLSLSVITVGETTPITSLTYGFRLYKSDGTKPVIVIHTTAFSSRSSHAFTIPSDCTDIRLYLAPHCDSAQDYVYISLKDIQIEQGSTATSYVPYQHL